MTTVIRKRSSAKKALAGRPSSTSTPIELPNGMQERIAKKAYELWHERGCLEGGHFQDWLDAETIVMEEIHEARE